MADRRTNESRSGPAHVTAVAQVQCAAGDQLAVHASLSGGTLRSVQGVFAPFRVTLDPVDRALNVPDGIGALGLADACGTLSVRSTAGAWRSSRMRAAPEGWPPGPRSSPPAGSG
jgi:hypothetical protein